MTTINAPGPPVRTRGAFWFCSVSLTALLAFAPLTFAAEPVPGGACTTNNYIVETGGPETSGIRHLLRCDGSTWQQEMTIDAAGRVGIGTATPTRQLDVFGYTGDVAGGTNVNLGTAITASANTSGQFIGTAIQSAISSNVNYSFLIAASMSKLYNGGTGTVETGEAAYNVVSNSNTGTMNNAYGTYSIVSQDAAGTIGNAAALSAAVTKTAGTITNAYGLYIGSLAGTNKWGVYQSDATASNFFAGGMQLDGHVELSGDISPAQITANQNDYNPTGLAAASVIRVNSDASRNIISLAGGTDGRVITIINIGTNNIVLKNDDGATGTAANRFALTGDLTLAAKQSAMLMYDSTASRWRQIANGTAAGGGGVSAIDDLTDAVYDTTADHNMVLGSNTAPTSGAVNNVWIGEGAGNSTTDDADDNVAIGFNALNANSTSKSSVAIGSLAMSGRTAGERSTAVGFSAMAYGTSNGDNNTAIGASAMMWGATGYNNTAVGTGAMGGSSSGNENSALGFGALGADSTGSSNTALGFAAAFNNNTGSNNVALGSWALGDNQTGDFNAALGQGALRTVNSGSSNTGVGPGAGGNITTGSRNIAIGYFVGTPSATADNQLTIGNLIYGTDLDGSGTTVSTGKIGIGDASPDHKLDVAGNIGLDAGSYINFGDTDGSSGYGIRDNSGSVEVKASGGSWATVPGYSSGTFTPVYAGTTTAGSCTYTRQLGSYVQVGKLVTFSIDIKWTACGTSPAGAPFLITGLPATSLNTANLYQSVGPALAVTAYTTAAASFLAGRIPPNTAQIELKQQATNGALTDVAVDVGADLTISGSYIAN